MHPEALRITASLICDFPSVCTVWRILLSDSGWMNIWGAKCFKNWCDSVMFLYKFDEHQTVWTPINTLQYVWLFLLWMYDGNLKHEIIRNLKKLWIIPIGLEKKGQNIKTAFWSFPSLLNTDLQVKNKHYRCFLFWNMVGQQANDHLGPAKDFFRSARNQLPGSKNTDTRKLNFALPQNNSNTINNVQLNKHQPSDNKKCLWCHKIFFYQSVWLFIFVCTFCMWFFYAYDFDNQSYCNVASHLTSVSSTEAGSPRIDPSGCL